MNTREWHKDQQLASDLERKKNELEQAKRVKEKLWIKIRPVINKFKSKPHHSNQEKIDFADAIISIYEKSKHWLKE